MKKIILLFIICGILSGMILAHAQSVTQQEVQALQTQIISDLQKWLSDNADITTQNQDVALDRADWQSREGKINADEADGNTQATLINAAELFINQYDESTSNTSCSFSSGNCVQNTDCCSGVCQNNTICE